MTEQNLAVADICYADLIKKKHEQKIDKNGKNDLKRHAISIEVIEKVQSNIDISIDNDTDKTIRLELRNPENECIVKKFKLNEKSDDADKNVLLDNSELSKYIKDNDSLIINGECDTNGIESSIEYLNGDGEKERLGGGGLGLAGGGFRGGGQPSLADFQPPYFPPPFAPSAHPATPHQQQGHGMEYGSSGGGEYGQHYAPQQLLPRHHGHHEPHGHLRHHRDHHDIHSHHLSHGGFSYSGSDRRSDYGVREQHELALHHALHSTDETQVRMSCDIRLLQLLCKT
ncbi:unnamed protein product [Leptosia nina]|uniref:Uncharacterized protein n=1 Tax=Leptosia nina TaxID=320188 RepID=A0AAV1J2Z2_9NEOP